MNPNTVTTKRAAVIGVSVLILFVIISLLSTSHAPAAAGPPTQPVTVMNTTANPVPVVQQGTPNVNVANTAASPALVRVVGPTAQPVIVTTQVNESQDESLIGQLYTVPAGKTLVVEYFSVLVHVGLDQKIILAQLYSGTAASPFNARAFFIPTFTGFSGDPSRQVNHYVISQTVKYFVAGGESITASFDTSPDTTTGKSAYCTITGYLVDAP